MNKKRCLSFASIMALGLLLLLISGCGSSNRDGDATTVSYVSNTACVTCHSASIEPLSGDSIVANYTASVHNLHSIGCQDCHGAGGSHNGVGPIPYPRPNYVQCADCHNNGVAISAAGVTSNISTVFLATNYQLVTAYSNSKHLGVQLEADAPCNRCHTHQGAVLSVVSHFTGDGTVMAAGVGAPGAITDAEPIKCDTCHVTHRTDKLRVDSAWDPSTTVGSVTSSLTSSKNDQFRLCTQCHGYTNPAGQLMGSGTVASGTALVGHHETSWYRIIGATHNQNATALAAGNITGYNIRLTLPDGSANPNPCFDCHGHEAMTNSNNDPASVSYDPSKATVYTDWAQSGHALGLLTAKYAAAAANPVNTVTQVDAVMAASVTGPFNGHNSAGCGRCHTTEGFSYFFENLTAIPGTLAKGVLKCYGCHTNPAIGALRTLKGAMAPSNYTTDLGWDPSVSLAAGAQGYTLNYSKKAYPNMAASNICISCHDGRSNDPGAITDAIASTEVRPHYLGAATTMFVKMGFIAFTLSTDTVPGSTTTYWNSLMSDQDGGTITSTHRKLGTPAIHGDSHNPTFFVAGNLDSNGPCVTCHLTGSHSLEIDQKAIDAVCSKCHTSEAGHSIATKADFENYFLEPQSEAYQAAITLAKTVFYNSQSILELKPEAGTVFLRAYQKGTTTSATAANWTAVATALGYDKTKLLGAISNIEMFSNDAAAFAHARTYSRRLLYDSIDFLDDGIINQSVGATALSAMVAVTMPGVYGKGATAFTDSSLSALAPGTTEAMVYLIGWSRTTGGWSSPERP